MFAYIMIGTNDRKKAEEFYDALMPELGLKRFMDFAHITFYGTELNQPFLGLCTPLDRNDACVGNGSMVALAGNDPETVDRVYNKAIELGAQCEGKPGARPAGFYCAYFRDLNGNKFNVCCPTPKES